MKNWYMVSFEYAEGIFCTNLAAAESVEDVRAEYAKYSNVTVNEAQPYEIESAKRRGMPVTECPHIEPEQPTETEPDPAENNENEEEETMTNYSYEECMQSDILDYIAKNINRADYIGNREELEEELTNDCWIADSVTGNASGSYYCNAYRSREAVIADGLDYIREACADFGIEAAEIGEKFVRQDWGWMDVTIRCYLLGGMISAVLDKLEETGYFEESEADVNDIITAAQEQLTA